MKRQTGYRPLHGEPRTFWDKIWKDEQGKRVIYQRPNAWIIIWAVCDIIAILSSSKVLSYTVSTIGAVALTIWALLELLQGANYFRRFLGFTVLAVTLMALVSLATVIL